LHNHYGPTETHVVTALTLTGDPEHWPSLPAIGRPVANTQLYVLNEQLCPMPIGVPGEIHIGGAGVARGYRNRPELTTERFLTDPFSEDRSLRLYKTGDLGRWNADGTLEYLGRNDDQVKIRGYRIELGEIEAQLLRHDQVREAAVLARADANGEKRLIAYVTPRIGSTPEEGRLRAHLSAVLPDHMIPSAFVVLEHFPLTPNGKLNRRALPMPQLRAAANDAFEAPQGDTEERLVGLWHEVLRAEPIGRAANFFELGGHSLHVMRLIVKITGRFGVDLSVPDVFKNPTIQQMATTIEELLSQGTELPLFEPVQFEEGVL